MREITLPGFKLYYSELDIKIEPCAVVQTLHLEPRKLTHDEPAFEARRGYTDLISKPNRQKLEGRTVHKQKKHKHCK